MAHWFWGAFFAVLGGLVVGAINFLLSRAVLRKNAEMFSGFSVLRQLLQVAYLVMLYLVAPKTPWGLMPLLVGGAIGISVAMFFSTATLVKENEKRRHAAEEQTQEREVE